MTASSLPRRRHDERGSALVITMLLMALLLLVAVLATKRGIDAAQAAVRQERRAVAFEAAEAGAADALQQVRAQRLGGGRLSGHVARGEYEVDVASQGWLGAWEAISVTSTGRCGEQERTLVINVLSSDPGDGGPAVLQLASWVADPR